MQMLVTDMTRMNDGFVCVAGIDLATGLRVRPVTGARLSNSLIASKGGVFNFRRVVDLGAVQPAPTPPEIEDVSFNPGAAKHVGTMQAEAFLRSLEEIGRAHV